MEGGIAPQSRNDELHDGEETPNLPEQVIMEEILPRLPVTSLLPSRCVSKSWYSLLSSKRFIKTHLNNSIENSLFAHHWIFFDYGEKKFKQCSLLSLFDNPVTNPISNSSGLEIDFGQEWVSGVSCCYGLVCIFLNWREIILWNPTTRKFKNLSDLYNLIQNCGVIRRCGFGFDELTDDYKILAVVNRTNDRGVPIGPIDMVYSLRSDSWMQIEVSDVPPFDDEGRAMDMSMSIGLHVSGRLHWYGRNMDIISFNCYGRNLDIISFDLNRHVYGVVEKPRYAKGYLRSVGVVGGCLSAHYLHQSGNLDVWVMKEYGVKESWDKVVTISYYDHLEIPTPIAIAPSGEVLLIYKSTAVVYNPKRDVFRRPRIIGLRDEFAGIIYSLGIYIESLTSLAPDA